ncbi:CYTH domain-containing protein [Pseudoxanthomonas sp. JBR18]|uniref:CYTH domain-containing protein n=1 Tax=Pseudoxanthomonas sp. JBR18 TaxID=2969308 RepID=UPI002305CA95|nr:CYTH domain-containing protein [Pseudoxanthomonas sp. JBR18]WCE04506.1 CYTH domain-containing protein [Pseudoxanthomonas sp. JBR18]
MAIEIERKFLVTNDGWRDAAHAVVPMAQGYLNDLGAVQSGAQKASVRVRVQGELAYLNIKSRELGHTRQEYEYPVPVADARALLELCVGGLVDKRRHLVRVGAHLWEVDEFLGENAGLLVAEIELASADEAFVRPDWIGAEVTDQSRYYNLALAAHPYARWSQGE